MSEVMQRVVTQNEGFENQICLRMRTYNWRCLKVRTLVREMP